MMQYFLSKLLQALIIVLALLLGIVGWELIQRSGVMDPQPLKDVKIAAQSMDDAGNLTLVITYVKLACEIRKIRAVGGSLGVVEDLPWRGLNTGDDPNLRDYAPGPQTSRLVISTQPTPKSRNDWAEIRLSHDCDGQQVDTVFVRIDLQDARFGGPRSLN